MGLLSLALALVRYFDSVAVPAAAVPAEANSIAQQALANVRTVYAFNGADRTVEAYAASLDTPMKVGVLGSDCLLVMTHLVEETLFRV